MCGVTPSASHSAARDVCALDSTKNKASPSELTPVYGKVVLIIKHEGISRRGGVAPRILWRTGTCSVSRPDRGKTPLRWALGPFRTLWGKEKCPAPAGNRNTVLQVSILPDIYVLIITVKKQKSQNPSLCGFLQPHITWPNAALQQVFTTAPAPCHNTSRLHNSTLRISDGVCF
jgi:hypothetical protein